VPSPFPFQDIRAYPELRAVIVERRKTKDLSRLALARFANQAQRVAGLPGEVNILLTGDTEIQQLNLQFRRKDEPTDVLSFPSGQPPAGGDIAISLETARAQAAEIGHDLLTEVKVLILHGMLHLAGHDHETDRGRMRKLEQRLRAELKLPAGLIERTKERTTERTTERAAAPAHSARRRS
jgi:probable rRNA maturation factor